MVIQNHKHNLVIEKRGFKWIEFVCVPREGEKDWACNYTTGHLSKQWVRDRVTGVPLKQKKRPGRG